MQVGVVEAGLARVEGEGDALYLARVARNLSVARGQELQLGRCRTTRLRAGQQRLRGVLRASRRVQLHASRT